MLDQLRQGAQGWVAKLLMAILLVSFVVWGIGSFEGFGTGTLATVGDQDISVQDFAQVYDQAQRAAQQSGRQVNPDEVLSRLLLTAALDDAARGYGLGISEERVAQSIADDPLFQGADGRFDQERFTNVLQSARIDRDDYISDVRRSLLRSQIADAVAAELTVPQPIVEAIYRLQNEERAVSFIVVDESAIEPVGTPSDSDLQAYFEDNNERFRAPEYRKLAMLTLDPAALADPAAVTDAEVTAEYERRLPNLSRPERRRVEQIKFAAADAAEKALSEVQSGKDFAAIAVAAGVAPADIDLGLKTRAEFLDPAIAEAAFAAAKDTPIAVTEGAIEPSLIRVVEIVPESVTPLAEIAPRLREEIAKRKASEELNARYDEIEDERAGGATLQEVADKMSLPYRVAEAVSRDSKTPEGGQLTDLPGGAQLVAEAFESDVGVENSPLRGEGDSWVFYEVLEVTPERDRTLDEVRSEATSAWAAAETRNRIAARADALFERLKSGEPLATLAAEIRKPVQKIASMKRGEPPPELGTNAAAQAFAGPKGHVANAEGEGASRILLQVDDVVVPAFLAASADAASIKEQLAPAFLNDVIASYNQQVLQSRETRVNNAAFQQLTGRLQTQ